MLCLCYGIFCLYYVVLLYVVWLFFFLYREVEPTGHVINGSPGGSNFGKFQAYGVYETRLDVILR